MLFHIALMALANRKLAMMPGLVCTSSCSASAVGVLSKETLRYRTVTA